MLKLRLQPIKEAIPEIASATCTTRNGKTYVTVRFMAIWRPFPNLDPTAVEIRALVRNRNRTVYPGSIAICQNGSIGVITYVIDGVFIGYKTDGVLLGRTQTREMSTMTMSPINIRWRSKKPEIIGRMRAKDFRALRRDPSNKIVRFIRYAA